MGGNPYNPPEVDAFAYADLTQFASIKSYGIDQTWRVDCPARTHSIRLLHKFWSGLATIEIDGDVIYHRPSRFVDWGLHHDFGVEGVAFAIRITPVFFLFRYELLIGP